MNKGSVSTPPINLPCERLIASVTHDVGLQSLQRALTCAAVRSPAAIESGLVELAGIEPATPWLQTRCSPS